MNEEPRRLVWALIACALTGDRVGAEILIADFCESGDMAELRDVLLGLSEMTATTLEIHGGAPELLRSIRDKLLQ